MLEAKKEGTRKGKQKREKIYNLTLNLETRKLVYVRHAQRENEKERESIGG